MRMMKSRRCLSLLVVACTRLREWPSVSPLLSMMLSGLCRPVDPNSFGEYERPLSVASSTNGIESGWRRRQTIKRGVTRKVPLTQGNFITEYPVPGPVYSAIESKWTSGTRTTEFSCVY